MTAVDAAILAAIALSTLIAAWRGLVRSLLSLVGWALAIVGTWLLGPWLAVALPQAWNPGLRIAFGHLAVFVLVLTLVSLIAIGASKLVTAAGLGGLDRSLGAVFGAVRGVLIVGAIAFVAVHVGLARTPAWTSSVLLPYLGAVLHAVWPATPVPGAAQLQV